MVLFTSSLVRQRRVPQSTKEFADKAITRAQELNNKAAGGLEGVGACNRKPLRCFLEARMK